MSLLHKIVSNETEFEAFREAVKSAGLPHQDLNYQNQVLISYYLDDKLVGTGGLEVIDRFALLRSVSVHEQNRGQNLGKQITASLLKNVEQSKLDAVFLLTETAKDFFEKQGFETVSRDSAPVEIQSTTQFSSMCPVSASFMVKQVKNHHEDADSYKI
jgi:amino-acid N-acetyltransferase